MSLKRHLNYNNFKRGLNGVNSIVKIAHDINNLSRKHHIKPIENLTNKILDNNNFKTFEKGLKFINEADNVYTRGKDLKARNIFPHSKEKYDLDHQHGVNNAKKPFENLNKRRLSISPIDENAEAMRIVNQIK